MEMLKGTVYKQCNGHAIAAYGSTSKLPVMPVYLLIAIAQCKAYQNRRSTTGTRRVSVCFSKCCQSDRDFAMHDFQLERGEVDSVSIHIVIQVFIFIQAPLQKQQ